MLRIILIVLLVPVLLVIAAALLLPVLLDQQKLLEIAAKTLHEQTGATLVVEGGADLSLFPDIALSMSESEISMPGDQPLTVRASSLDIGLKLKPLLSGNVEIEDILVDGLRARVQSAPAEESLDTSTLSDAELDAYYAQRRQKMADAAQAAGQEAVIAVPLALNVQRLVLTDVIIETVSAETGDVTQLNIVRLAASDLNLENRVMPIRVALQIPGEEGAPPIEIALEGQVRVDVEAQQVALEAMTATVTGVLAQPVGAALKGLIDLPAQAADLQLTLDIGDTQGEGTVRYASFETPQINADLKLNQFDPVLFALAGPDAGAAAETEKVDSAGGDEPLPLDAIRAIDTKATLAIERAVFSGHPVENMQVKLRAVDGVVRVNSLTGKLHGGKLAMKAVFNAQHNTAKLSTNGSLSGLNIARALKAMESEPLMTGKANLTFKLNSSGSTSNALIEAMSGPIQLDTKKVVLQKMGIEKMLCEAVALANRESLKAQLPEVSRFENLSVDLKMKQGKLLLKPLKAELEHVRLKGEGEMVLLAGDFDATFTASLSKSLGKVDPACRVNDRITAIGWPVECKGNVAGDPAD